MHSNIKLGRISGIEIGLHYSWFHHRCPDRVLPRRTLPPGQPALGHRPDLDRGAVHRCFVLRHLAVARTLPFAGGPGPRDEGQGDHPVRAGRCFSNPGGRQRRENRILGRDRRADRQPDHRVWLPRHRGRPWLAPFGRTAHCGDRGPGLVGIYQHWSRGLQHDSWLSARWWPGAALDRVGDYQERRWLHPHRRARRPSRGLSIHSLWDMAIF